jgi:hypothetical protein
MKLWYKIFPNYELVRTVTGIWNISVTDFLFGNYSENKYCRFYLKYSKRINHYKVSCSGYNPKDHALYTVYVNESCRLNNEVDK